jgi:hypothetical protein
MRWPDETPVTGWLGNHEWIVKIAGAIHYEIVKPTLATIGVRFELQRFDCRRQANDAIRT